MPKAQLYQRLVMSSIKKLYEGYTRKMWGTDPEKLSPEITQRIPVRVNTDDRLSYYYWINMSWQLHAFFEIPLPIYYDYLSGAIFSVQRKFH